jgi:hypothetical protein
MLKRDVRLAHGNHPAANMAGIESSNLSATHPIASAAERAVLATP